MSVDRPIRNGVVVLLSCVAPALVGCGGTDRDTHKLTGVVSWPGGDLTGHTVEFASEADTTLRGHGALAAGGRFTAERYHAGRTTPGLPAGRYTARLVLADEGDGQAKKPKVPARYLDHKTSGWSVTVPATGDVTLTVAAK